MALLASRCHSGLIFHRLLARTALLTQVPDRQVAVRSKQFPEYSVLYDLPQIRAAGIVNRMKLHATVIYTCGMPMIYIAKPYVDYYLFPQIYDSFSAFGGFIVIFLHSIGFLFNNAIGFIYIKDDEKSLKFSYVNYWGNRKNTDASIDEVCPLSEPTNKIKDRMYQKVRLTTLKRPLKLFVEAGKVLDYRIFNAVFGKIRP